MYRTDRSNRGSNLLLIAQRVRSNIDLIVGKKLGNLISQACVSAEAIVLEDDISFLLFKVLYYIFYIMQVFL